MYSKMMMKISPNSSHKKKKKPQITKHLKGVDALI